MAGHDVDGTSWNALAGRVANVQRDKCEKPVSGTARSAIITAIVQHGLKQLAAVLGENSGWRKAEGLKLEQLMGNSGDCATIQHGTASWTYRES
jgi:hypothetical protein